MNAADKIRELRNRTKAGLLDCKNALEANDMDLEKAVDFLRKKGVIDAMSAKPKIATDGLITSYIHTNGRIGVLVEINCETDFVARTEDFRAFCKDVAMHIAGHMPPPQYVDEASIPPVEVLKERLFLTDKATQDPKFMNKPLEIKQKALEGQLSKWKKSISLMDQQFVKDPEKDIRTLLLELKAKTKEEIIIRRFTRYELGEGLEKKTENFAEEVRKQLS